MSLHLRSRSNILKRIFYVVNFTYENNGVFLWLGNPSYSFVPNLKLGKIDRGQETSF